MIAASLVMSAGVAFAQQSKSDESLEFRPHWTLGVQGGVSHTIGEASFGELLSPSAQLTVGYNFHHAMGVRLGFGGWQGKGGVLTESVYNAYAFKFGQLSADYVLYLADLFGGFRHDRVVNPYLFAGVGVLYGFDNEQAAPYKEDLEYYWDAGKFFAPGRVGLGVDFRLGKCVSLGLEGNTLILSDRFNSKRAENVDWHISLLAGLKFAFGGNTRPSKAYADKLAAEAAAKAAAEAEAARLAAEKTAAEKAAREAAERAEAERLAAERAAREAAERAAAARVAMAQENSDNVFFTIGSTKIRKAEDEKLVKLAEWMGANPDFNVVLVGHADKETGTARGNQKLSENRAKVVKERLVKLGVAEARIATDAKGDTAQPFEENAKNRVVTCTLE